MIQYHTMTPFIPSFVVPTIIDHQRLRHCKNKGVSICIGNLLLLVSRSFLVSAILNNTPCPACKRHLKPTVKTTHVFILILHTRGFMTILSLQRPVPDFDLCPQSTKVDNKFLVTTHCVQWLYAYIKVVNNHQESACNLNS